MISGVMPRRKQIFHVCVAAFLFSVFAGAAFVNAQLLLPSHKPPVDPLLRAIAFLFILLAVGVIAMQVWYRRRIIREFSYDGATLHYQTLSRAEAHSRFPAQLVAIRDWAGRGGVMGYQLIFRDHPKAYLEDDTPNASKLIERLVIDMEKGAALPVEKPNS
jgi:hypothetical protein